MQPRPIAWTGRLLIVRVVTGGSCKGKEERSCRLRSHTRQAQVKTLIRASGHRRATLMPVCPNRVLLTRFNAPHGVLMSVRLEGHGAH
jgi:hypothetical protein